MSTQTFQATTSGSSPKRELSYRREVTILLLALAVTAELLYLNLTRYWNLLTPMGDLAAMTQAIWSVLQGKFLVTTVHSGIPSSRLLDHAELIYFLLAPLFKAFPTPVTLLVVQIFAYASAALPIYQLGERYGHQGQWITFLYLFYPVAQTAVLGDFHADPLAMGFLFWALHAMEKRQWRSFGLWTLLILTCKIYMVAPILLLSLLLWRQREKKAALYLALSALLWGVFITFGLKIWLAPLFHTTPANALQGYVGYRYGNLFGVLRLTWQERLFNFLIVIYPLLPWLLVSPRAFLPAAILLVPVLGTSIRTYHYFYHHYAIVVPFLIYGALQADRSLRKRTPLWKRSKIWSVIAVLSGHLVLVIGIWFIIAFPSQPWRNSAVRVRSRQVLQWATRQIPPASPLIVSSNLAPFFATRPWIIAILYLPPTPQALSHAELALIDLFQEGAIYGAGIIPSQIKALRMLLEQGWEPQDMYDGLMLLAASSDNATLPWGLHIVSPSEARNICPQASPEVILNAAVRLVCSSFTFKDGHLQARFVWHVVEPPTQNLFPITRIGGWVPNGERFPHFLLWGMYPASRWQAGQLLVEEMTWPLHLSPGCYPVDVGFYYPTEAYPLTADSNLQGSRAPLGALSVIPSGEIFWTSSCSR